MKARLQFEPKPQWPLSTATWVLLWIDDRGDRRQSVFATCHDAMTWYYRLVINRQLQRRMAAL